MQKFTASPISPPPITTAIEPVKDWLATPRAQTRQEAEMLELEKAKNQRSGSLEGRYIPQIFPYDERTAHWYWKYRHP